MRILLVSLFSLTLTACGWQLRGSSDLDAIGELQVTGGSFELRRDLIQTLERNGITVEAHAPFTLALSSEQWRRRVVAVDSQGREIERELRFSLQWRLRDNDDQSTAEQSTVRITRSFNFDPSNPATAADEEALTRNNIYRDAISQLIRQLEALSRNIISTGQDLNTETD